MHIIVLCYGRRRKPCRKIQFIQLACCGDVQNNNGLNKSSL